MSIDKGFQLFLLDELAKRHPYGAEPIWNELISRSCGETYLQKRDYLCSHLYALECFGYVERLFNEYSAMDGHYNCNSGCCITPQGLLEVGVDLVHPNPNKEIIDALMSHTQELHKMSESQQATLKTVLVHLPRVALERLMDRGVGALLDLIL